jgi:hypothetical protein
LIVFETSCLGIIDCTFRCEVRDHGTEWLIVRSPLASPFGKWQICFSSQVLNRLSLIQKSQHWTMNDLPEVAVKCGSHEQFSLNMFGPWLHLKWAFCMRSRRSKSRRHDVSRQKKWWTIWLSSGLSPPNGRKVSNSSFRQFIRWRPLVPREDQHTTFIILVGLVPVEHKRTIFEIQDDTDMINVCLGNAEMAARFRFDTILILLYLNIAVSSTWGTRNDNCSFASAAQLRYDWSFETWSESEFKKDFALTETTFSCALQRMMNLNNELVSLEWSFLQVSNE